MIGADSSEKVRAEGMRVGKHKTAANSDRYSVLFTFSDGA